MIRRFALLGALGAVCSTCALSERAPVEKPAPDLLVRIRSGSVIAPDSVPAGWARLRVEEDGAGHILVVFRLAGSVSDSGVAAFLAALDTARATPTPGHALGGPEIGDTGEVVIELTPGGYVLGCVSRGRGEHRHANLGEAKTLVVFESDAISGTHAAAPQATQEIRLVDFAFVGAERWQAGPHLLRVENTGRQDHQLRLLRLRAGSTVEDWLSSDGSEQHSTSIAGIARMGPGRVAYLPVDLPRGTYVLYCLVPEAVSGRPHIELGMFRSITVQ